MNGNVEHVVPAPEMGDRIRRAREARDISQSDLAKQLGVEQSHVWKWENDRRVPRLRTLARMAQILNVSIDHIVLGRPGAGGPTSGAAA